MHLHYFTLEWGNCILLLLQDSNKDGKLDDNEIEHFITGNLGLDPEKTIVAKLLMDVDGDGVVEPEEVSNHQHC
jgi:Ca2+-binding EF-hand superfamily protein